MSEPYDIGNQPALEVTAVIEGQFLLGKLNGYGRRINCKTGITEVGFFRQDVPSGKYCQYNLDGSYAMSEGIYEGYSTNGALLCKTRMNLTHYHQSISGKETAKESVV